MHSFLLIAAVLSLLACLAHGIWGHKVPIVPMLTTDLGQVPKLELAGVWHMLTLGFGLAAITLFQLARTIAPSVELLAFLGWQFFGYGAAIFAVVLWQKGSLVKVPQWLLMWIIAALIYWS